jgi:hypothetical protein
LYQPEKNFKDGALNPNGNARPGIDHGKLDPVAVQACKWSDFASFRELDGVMQ